MKKRDFLKAIPCLPFIGSIITKVASDINENPLQCTGGLIQWCRDNRQVHVFKSYNDEELNEFWNELLIKSRKVKSPTIHITPQYYKLLTESISKL